MLFPNRLAHMLGQISLRDVALVRDKYFIVTLHAFLLQNNALSVLCL